MMHHHHSEENRTRDAASQSQQPNSPPPTRQTKSFTNVIKTDLDNKCTDAPLELFKKIYDSFFPCICIALSFTYCPQPQKVC